MPLETHLVLLQRGQAVPQLRHGHQAERGVQVGQLAAGTRETQGHAR